MEIYRNAERERHLKVLKQLIFKQSQADIETDDNNAAIEVRFFQDIEALNLSHEGLKVVNNKID